MQAVHSMSGRKTPGGLDLVQEERNWLRDKIVSFLHRTRDILRCVGDASLNDDTTVDALVALLSPEEVVSRLGGETALPAKVFRALFADDDEWEEAKRSASCIVNGDMVEASRLRLERQRKLLSACVIAVPIMEQQQEDTDKELWLSCAEEVERVCDAFGIALRRAAASKTIVPSELLSKQPQKGRPRRRDRLESENDEEKEMEVQEQQVKSKRVKVGVSRPSKLSKPNESVTPEQESNSSSSADPLQQNVSDQEDDEMEMDNHVEDDAEENYDDAIRQSLVHARQEADELFVLVHEKSGKSIEVGQLIAPDASLATAAEGAKLLKDVDLLLACFRHDGNNLLAEATPLERLGVLLKWWRLVRRCYSIVAIFEHLSATKGKQGIVSFYNETVRPMSKSCSYAHATRLERIGRLVLRYPRLLYQTQFTSITEWHQKVSSTARPLLDSMEQLLSANNLAFWMMQRNNNHADACIVCDDHKDGLWNCSDCSCWFHEECAGYEAGSLSLGYPLKDGQVLETWVLCSKCLEKNELDHDYVARETHEKSVVAAFLNADGCPFVLRRVEPDGTCLFRVLFDFAVGKLGFRGSFAVFCKKLADAALKATAEVGRELGRDGVEAESVKELERLKKSRDPVRHLQRGAWENIEAQQVLRGFVRMFPGACVKRFAVCGDAVKEREVYGSGPEEFYVLQWIRSLHFDELQRRG